MSRRTIGILMIILGILAFHLLGSQPETAAIWTTYINNKIYSDPVEVAGKVIFMGGNKGKKAYFLYEVDKDGKVSAESVKLPVLPYQPIGFAKRVVIADKSNMIRGFSVPGLNLEWESGAAQPIALEPLKIGKDKILVSSGRNFIFCLDNETGKPVWDHQFSKTLVNFAADEIVACITGYTDLKEPSWSLTGHSTENGELLWTYEEPVSGDKPLFIQGLCLTTTASGQLIILNQRTGQAVYRHSATGLKAIQLLDDRLILLAAGGSRVVSLSLMTGDSWTTTMNSAFTGAAKYGNSLLLSNKKSVRCVNANTGALFWDRNLGDIYNAFPFRKGIFITHKDSFFDRSTYGSYLSVESGTPIWTTYGKSIFQKPVVTSQGDLVVAYNGMIRMLPSPRGSSSGQIDFPDSGKAVDKIEFWKEETASASEKIEPDSVSAKQQPEPEESSAPSQKPIDKGSTDKKPETKKPFIPDDQIEEPGWVTDKP
ncbi:MAG: hypothetical protein PWR01_2549 [Clostridiales bacterium]|jgi:outer membrane protein assembly factor BamB|nr:hypothetical protein [Clostridiales bacterium]MDN5281476.1 hypothetical protein [Candidatus Ozemobacter sp.]